MTKTEPHIDINGVFMEVGDCILYSAADDRSSVLRYGLVVALKEGADSGWRKGKPKVGVKALHRGYHGRGWKLMNGGRTVTLAFTERMAVVPPNFVPDEVIKIFQDFPEYKGDKLGE